MHGVDQQEKICFAYGWFHVPEPLGHSGTFFTRKYLSACVCSSIYMDESEPQWHQTLGFGEKHPLNVCRIEGLLNWTVMYFSYTCTP